MMRVGLVGLVLLGCVASPEGLSVDSLSHLSDSGTGLSTESCEVVSTEVAQLTEADARIELVAKIVDDLPGRFEGTFFHASESFPAEWVVDKSLGEVRMIQMAGPGIDCQDHYEVGFGVNWRVEGWLDARFTTLMEIVPGEFSLYEVDLPGEAVIGPTVRMNGSGQDALLLEGSYDAGVWQGSLTRMGPEPRTLGSFILSKVD